MIVTFTAQMLTKSTNNTAGNVSKKPKVQEIQYRILKLEQCTRSEQQQVLLVDIISIHKMYFLPIHRDVEHISWAHNSLIANNISKIGKPLIVRVIEIHL